MKSFKLDNEPKIKPGFTTPDNYFGDFTEKMMAQLPEQETARIIPLKRKKTAWMYAVAAILIVALSVTFIFRTGAVQPDDDAIENYLVYQGSITTYDIIQELDDSDIAELEQSLTISDEAIENYFSTQNNYDYLND